MEEATPEPAIYSTSIIVSEKSIAYDPTFNLNRATRFLIEAMVEQPEVDFMSLKLHSEPYMEGNEVKGLQLWASIEGAELSDEDSF